MIQRGMLSDYFEGVAVKKLSAVETSPDSSNQHEFNGVNALRQLLGDEDRKRIPTQFIWLNSEQEGISDTGFLTWYDARRRHPTRTEYRAYYDGNNVTTNMHDGDTFFFALRRDNSGLIVITPANSTIHNQLLWLFGIEEQPEIQFTVQEIRGNRDAQLDYTARYILDELGIELSDPQADEIDKLIEPYGKAFPKTKLFSELARSSLPHISPATDDPDATLMAWLEQEELLFRRLERRIVSERLTGGFVAKGEADVEGFLSFSLSVQNRRKARAGQALENHLEALFVARSISYSRGATTEHGHKPDFLFPGTTEYHDVAFPAEKLTMLGSKSSLKDRWRQVLTEAARINQKHLLTLEPAISERQTDQMMEANLQLVLPASLHKTYRKCQQSRLMNLKNFVDLVEFRQPA